MALSGETFNVKMPESESDKVTVRLRPLDSLKLSGVDMKNLAIDILGPDIIFSDISSGSRIIFPGLGLILFSTKESPSIYLNGELINSDKLLSFVGKIQNITQKDYLSFTSLEITPKENEEKKKGGDEDAQKQQSQEQQDEILALIAQQKPQSQKPDDTPEQAPETQEGRQQRAEFQQDAVGAPPSPINYNTSKSSSSSSSAPPVEQKTNDAPVTTPEEPGSVRTTFDFDARILQVTRTESDETVASVLTHVIRGGGGSQASAYDPANDKQYATEFLDTVSDGRDMVIYADNPNYFSDTQAARVIQFSPNLPNGFDLTQVTISGLPAGLTIEGATYVGGNYVIVNPVLDSRGDVNLTLLYDIPGNLAFTMTFTLDATFNPASGYDTPTQTSLSYEAEQKVEMRDVSSSTDMNYVDGDGDLVWVLANTPNANRIATGDGNITVYGGKGVDSVTTGAGNDLIQGGRGNDQLDAGAGNDTVDYSDTSAGVTLDLGSTPNVDGYVTATLVGGEYDLVKGFENINGSLGNDTLTGDSGANILSGSNGDDLLKGMDGNDTLIGGGGLDTVDYSYAGNGISLTLSNSGSTTVNVSGTDIDTIGEIENVIGTDYDDVLTGSDVANILSGGLGNDTLVGGLGNDTLDGGVGLRDLVDYSGAAAGVTLNLSGAQDADGYVTAYIGASEQDKIKGIEDITGSAFADILTGDASNQTIHGGAGNDQISAGDGDDIVYGGTGSDTLNGGLGNDTLNFSDLTGGGVTINIQSTSASYAGDGSVDTFSNFETYILTNQADSITGSNTADTIYGLDGDDHFYATTGNDYLDAGAGAGDTIDYTSAGSAVTVNLNTQSGSGIGTHTLIGFENAIGSSLGDTITGSTAANLLQGGDGNDMLRGIGITGIDYLDGQGGTDTVSFDYLGVSTSTNGIVATFSTLDSDSYYSIADRVSGTVFAKVKNVEIFEGSNYQDTITGDGMNNIIYGLDGNDTINGQDGSDTIYGGNGNDTLLGGNGIDTIYGGAGSDTITGGAGNDTLYGEGDDDTFIAGLGADYADGGSGTDTVNYNQADFTSGLTIDMRNTSDQFVMYGAEKDTLVSIERIVGSDYADIYYGSSGDDYYTEEGLTSGSGSDTVYGSLGNDYYNVGAGVDVINYSLATAGVTINLGTSSVTGWGTATIYGFDNIVGSDYADSLTGNSSANTIQAGAGNDIIFYSAGNDTIDGGTSDGTDYNDLLSYGAAPTFVVADMSTVNGSGYFTVTIGSKQDLAINVESIRGSDSYSDTITGNNAKNTIAGGGGDDILSGKGGDDYIIGESGNDTIDGGSGNDYLDGGLGTDTINYLNLTGATSITFNLSSLDAQGYASVSVAGLGETDHIKNFEIIYGTTGADSMTGDGLANELHGGDGNDSIWGGAGTDTLYGDVGADYLYGEADNDVIYGGGGDDYLYGSDGDDWMYGQAGNDTIDGGNGSDTVSYADSSVTASVSVSLLAGTATGGGGNDTLISINAITGSAYNDTLIGDNNVNVINGGAGGDDIYGNDGNDSLYGGDGDDTIRGGNGADFLYGENGNDILIGGAGNDTMNGGAGSQDTADYSASTSGITITVSGTTSTVTGGADVGTDTLTFIERIIGTNYADTMRGVDGVNDILEGGGGADYFYNNTGNNTINGGDALDTMDYSASATLITGAFQAVGGFLTGSVSRSDGSFDTLSLVEIIKSTGYSDTFTFDTGSILALSNINFGAGYDKATISNGASGNLSALDIDGDTLRTVFSNVEEINLQGSTLTGPDVFDISGLDVKTMTSANSLKLVVSNGFNFSFDNESGYNVTSNTYNSTSGGTVTWQNGAETVTLQVTVV